MKTAPTGTSMGANYGVLIDMGGSANVRFNRIKAIRDLPLTGVQEGIGVQFGFTNGSGSVLSGGSGTVWGNVISDYQKGGVVVIGSASKADVKQNNIVGQGPTSVVGQNGIQISHGARADVEGNCVSDNNYTGTGFSSAGILIYQTKYAEIKFNDVTGNNEGIFLYQADYNKVQFNAASDNTEDGIVVWLSNRNSIVGNWASNNGVDGIVLDTAKYNVIERNLTFCNGLHGIELTPNSTNNTVRKNWLGENDGGNLLIGSPNNTVYGNHFVSLNYWFCNFCDD